MSDLTRVILAIAISFVLTLIIGRFLIPMLRALKAGQSILEIGPNWHASKNGTPVMGGIMFITTSLLMCVILGWQGILQGDHAQLGVYGMAFCFGLIGFADDLCKVKFKRNLGLTSLQKSALQMIVSGVFLYFMYSSGHMSTELYIPFFNVSWSIHPMVYILFAMFVIVGCVNAVNLTDGVDGLSSSVTIPVMVFFTVVCRPDWRPVRVLSLQFPSRQGFYGRHRLFVFGRHRLRHGLCVGYAFDPAAGGVCVHL